VSTSRAKKKRRQQARGSGGGGKGAGAAAGDGGVGGGGKGAGAAAGGGGAGSGGKGAGAAAGDGGGVGSGGKGGGAAAGATGGARAAERGAGAEARGGPARTDRVSRFEVRDGVPRPDAVWAPFPLTEIGMAAGLVIFIAGFATGGSRGGWLLAVGALVLVVVTAELSLREHFAGFRSHTMLLAVLPVVVLHATIALAISSDWGGPLVLGIDVLLAAGLAWLLHGRFKLAHERAVEAS
jgi:hypothetical protein